MNLSQLSDDELLASLSAFIGEANRVAASIVAYLVEVEDRRLHLAQACPSLTGFCRRRLGMSEGAAYRKVNAVHLVRRFPKLLYAIASGRAYLSNLVLMREVLRDPKTTEHDVDALIDATAGKSKREVQELLVRRAPKPDVPSSIRRVPQQESLASTLPGAVSLAQPPVHVDRGRIEPRSPDRHQVQFMASDALRAKIERARELMSHANPSGDLGVVFEKAVDVLLAQLEKTKLGKVDRPRKARPMSKRGDVSRAARRAVVERDGAQCSFVSEQGERCPCRSFLEIDHRLPRALGGTGDVSNLRLLCRAHNRYAAEQVFGREHLEAQTAHRQRSSRSTIARPRPPEGDPTRELGEREPSEDHRPNHQHEPEPAAPPASPASPAKSQRDVRESSESAAFSMPSNEHAVASGAPDHSERVRSALVHLGFRNTDARRAVTALEPTGWSRPLETLIREALHILA